MKRNKSSPSDIQLKDTRFQLGRFLLDCNNMVLISDEETIRLTGREADLLVYFIKNKNKLIKRRDILIALWGKDDYFLGRSLDVFISRLRKFLSSDANVKIENIPRVGFKFRMDE